MLKSAISNYCCVWAAHTCVRSLNGMFTFPWLQRCIGLRENSTLNHCRHENWRLFQGAVIWAWSNSASQWRIAGSTDGIVHIWVHIPVMVWPSGIWTHPIIPGSWLQLCWSHGHAGSHTGPLLIWQGRLSVKPLLRLSGRTLNRKQKSADYLRLNCFEEMVVLFIPEKWSWVVSWWLANACKCWHNSCFWG